MTDEQKQVLELFSQGHTQREIASMTGRSYSAVKNMLSRARRWQESDAAVVNAAKAIGADDTATVSHGWQMVKDKDGNGFSVFFKNHNTGEVMDFADMVKGAISEALDDKPPSFEPRILNEGGEHLLVVDLADVHFGKLCVETETGYGYNRDVARHRVIEGTKSLLAASKVFGVHRILFIMGNDILHTDNGKTTTSGTQQDTDGSFYQNWSAAFAAYKEAIELCADVAPVDLIHCMSNHDWRSGWTLAQAVASWFQAHPNINATEYALSERHRKYYAYGNNALQITHADGAKEESLLALFLQEARHLLRDCQNLYSVLHHFHHKIKKKRGLDVFTSEKDHIGFTAIKTGHQSVMGSHLQIEYVRSPGPPDGWHDRNGYVNRQAVECFLYHPEHGQKIRFTEWF